MPDNWTRDASGCKVLWNRPPYWDPDTGRLTLLLDGEDPRALNDFQTCMQRIEEYYLLVWRDSGKIRSPIKKPPPNPERKSDGLIG